MAADVFVHGVASGDPLDDRVMVWTRVSGAGDGGADVAWTIATDPGLEEVVAAGEGRAEPEADFTVHVDVTGLRPGSTYWYGFRYEGSCRLSDAPALWAARTPTTSASPW